MLIEIFFIYMCLLYIEDMEKHKSVHDLRLVDNATTHSIFRDEKY